MKVYGKKDGAEESRVRSAWGDSHRVCQRRTGHDRKVGVAVYDKKDDVE